MSQLSFSSPVGWLSLEAEANALVRVTWRQSEDKEPTPLLHEARRQIEAYLGGRLTRFDLPLDARGGAFERDVWRLMQAIPYGRTRNYGDIALELGQIARAVGQACGSNPIPIVIPCHRVVAADGLGGFSGGAGRATKRWLLSLEERGSGGPRQGDLFAAVTSP